MTLDPDPLTYLPEPGTDDEPWTVPPKVSDADKLRLLALWFDMWDRPDTDRQRILDDSRNPGRNDVQRDLRRMAAEMERQTVRIEGWPPRLWVHYRGRFLGSPAGRRPFALAVLIIALAVVAIVWWPRP